MTLVAAQLTAIVVFGVLTAERSMIWGGGGDERAHFSYVQYLAEDHRLPLIDRDYVSEQVQAITDSVYPRSSPSNVHHIGLRGRSYEAFQPPLYYLTAVPIYNLASNYLDKVRLLRLYDLALLLVSVGLCAALAREVFGSRWMGAFSLALTVFLWPAVLVRGVTISNAALEMPLVLLLALALWRAESTGSNRALLVAGTLLGLCLLTQVTLIFLVPLVLLVAARRLRRSPNRRSVLAVGVALVIPLALLAPWVAFNERHFHAPTANAVALKLQRKAVNRGRHYSVAAVASGNAQMLAALIPDEWSFAADHPAITVATGLVDLVLLGGAVVGAIVGWRRRSRQALVLALPMLLWWVTMNVTTVSARWNLLLPRYGYPALPLLALFTAGTLTLARDRTRLASVTSSALTAVLVGVWIWLAALYF